MKRWIVVVAISLFAWLVFFALMFCWYLAIQAWGKIAIVVPFALILVGATAYAIRLGEDY